MNLLLTVNPVARRVDAARLRGGRPSGLFVLHAGDAAAAICAVVAALWSWAAIDGQPLTLQYVWDHAAWFALAAGWRLFLQPASVSLFPSSRVDVATGVTRAVVASGGLDDVFATALVLCRQDRLVEPPEPAAAALPRHRLRVRYVVGLSRHAWTAPEGSRLRLWTTAMRAGRLFLRGGVRYSLEVRGLRTRRRAFSVDPPGRLF